MFFCILILYCSYTEDEELQTFADTPIPDDPQLNPPIPFEEGIISFAGKIHLLLVFFCLNQITLHCIFVVFVRITQLMLLQVLVPIVERHIYSLHMGHMKALDKNCGKHQ